MVGEKERNTELKRDLQQVRQLPKEQENCCSVLLYHIKNLIAAIVFLARIMRHREILF